MRCRVPVARLFGLVVFLGLLVGVGVLTTMGSLRGKDPGCTMDSIRSGVVVESDADREWRRWSQLTASQKRAVRCESGYPMLRL